MKRGKRNIPILPQVGNKIDAGDSINQGLLGLWLLNEGGGTIASDARSPLRGTVSTAAAWGQNLQSKAFLGNGSSSNINLNRILGNNASTQSHSYSAWIRTASNLNSVYAIILSNSDAGAGDSMCLFYNGSSVGQLAMLYTGGGARDESGFTISVGVTYHVAVTYYAADNKYRYYVNGRLVATSGAVGAFSAASSVNSMISQGYTTFGYFDGLINNVRFWNRLLTPNEVKRLYENPYAGIEVPGYFTVQGEASVPSTTQAFAGTTYKPYAFKY